MYVIKGVQEGYKQKNERGRRDRAEMRSSMKKTKRQMTAGIAAMLVLAMTLGGCGSAAQETDMTQEESAVTVSTQSVQTGTITLNNSFMGVISPEEMVMVIPLTVGTVTETFFEVGDTVQAGDVLFKIDDEAAKLQYETAKLGVKNAQQTADSTMDNLMKQQDSTELQLESSALQTKSSFEQAQIGYVTAKNAYEAADKNYNEVKKQLEDMKALQGNAVQNTVSGSDVGGQANIKALEDSLKSLGSLRDQAYQAYLTARSGYNTAQQAVELTDETELMTQEQLDQTVITTEDQLALSIDMARISAAQAELALDMYTVTAPVSGVIESKGVEVNGIVSQSSPAYTIVNNNTMTVTFQVSEAVKNTLSVGQQVTLERNDNTYTASVTEIGTSVNPQSGLFQIKACVAANGTELPNGVSVKVSADTYRAENTMIIPYEAVYYENEGAYVYTSVNGRAVKTSITTGIFDDENIVVTGGLNLGDIVVTSWSPQLTDGVLLHAVDAGNGEVTADAEKEADTDAQTDAETDKAE